MEIYLLDLNKNITDAWEHYFKGAEKDGDTIHIVYDVFDHFMNTHKIDCVVSPANSYGLMDGGYDAAITDYFGKSLISSVQDYIRKHYFCEQPVGTSFIIPIPQSEIRLIHTPSMRVPNIIKDPIVVYHCMRSTLICAMQNGVKSIVIPAFGGFCGKVPVDTLAQLMRAAYDQLHEQPTVMDWKYALSRKLEEL
eukprot:jgi/Orpsp1_1/1188504/evm.model.d7180000065374.1